MKIHEKIDAIKEQEILQKSQYKRVLDNLGKIRQKCKDNPIYKKDNIAKNMVEILEIVEKWICYVDEVWNDLYNSEIAEEIDKIYDEKMNIAERFEVLKAISKRINNFIGSEDRKLDSLLEQSSNISDEDLFEKKKNEMLIQIDEIFLDKYYANSKEQFKGIFDNGKDYGLKGCDLCKDGREIKNLYRALKNTKDYPDYVSDPEHFIPSGGSLSRFNPPNRAFIYLAYDKEHESGNCGLSNAEKTCIKEIRAEKGTNDKISFLKFYLKDPDSYKFFNLEMDVETILREWERNIKEVRKSLERQIKHHNREKGKNFKFKEDFSKDKTYTYITKLMFLLISDIALQPLKDEKRRWSSYLPFHMMSDFIKEELQLDGILYPSTQMMKEGEKGHNLVIFNKENLYYDKSGIKKFEYV